MRFKAPAPAASFDTADRNAPACAGRRPFLVGAIATASGLLIPVTAALADPTKGRKTKISIASTFPADSPMDTALVYFKNSVEKQTGGRIQVAVQKAGAMGDENQTFQMLSQGSVEMGAVGTADISSYFPKYFMSEVPYMMSSVDQFWAFWNGPGKELSAMIEKSRGVKTSGVIYRGARYLTSNRSVANVADVKGLKMRLPPVKTWFKVWEALGAVPSTIAFSEVYMALKTGVVEAQENPPETILAYKMYEAQKYLITTEHIYSAARIQSSKLWWDSLPKADQTLLEEALAQGVAKGNELTRNGDAPTAKKLQELGMTLVNVDKAEFKKAAQPVIDQIAASDWDKDFYKKVQAVLS